MRVGRGTETKAVICRHELEGSEDLVEAINRSEMARLGCRKNGVKSVYCKGLVLVRLQVTSTKNTKKIGKGKRGCPA